MNKSILVYILFLFSLVADGQRPLSLSFHHLTREEGLSNNNIFYMYRDSRGFLWLGTYSGLNRFDGIRVKTYTSANSGLKGSIIFNIIEDKNGDLWIGSNKGLQKYIREKDQITSVPSPASVQVSGSFPYTIDDQGRLWTILKTGEQSSLYTYVPSSGKYTMVVPEITDHLSAGQPSFFRPVRTIYSSGKGNTGLLKFSIEGEKVTRVEHFFEGKSRQPLLSNIEGYIHAENDSTLWITNNALGLIRFNPLKNTFQSFRKFDHRPVKVLTQSVSFKNILIIGSYEGLYVFDKQKLRFVQHIKKSPFDPNSLMANWIEKPYIDEDGNFFVSQPGFGVDYTNLKRVIAGQWLGPQETSRISLPDNHVSYIRQRGSQTWAKFQNDLTVALDSTGKIMRSYENTFPLLNDSQNRMWLLTGDTLVVTDPEKKFRKKLFFPGLGAITRWQAGLSELSKTEYLLSGEKGLFLLDESKRTLKGVEVFNKKKTISSTPVYYDKVTKQLLVSTNWWSSFYVMAGQSGKWKIRGKISFPFRVFAVRPARDTSKIWLGTNSGLVLFDKQTFRYKVTAEKDGLPDNNVTDIVEEEGGNYWLVTNRGISYYNAARKEYRNFTAKDGTFSHEYDWNCAFRLPDQRMVFGGTNGITVISRKGNLEYTVSPKLQVEQFFIHEKPVKSAAYIGESETVKLKPEENSFAFDLAGIEYGFPGKVKIHYQLKGYDKQWITSANPATARYTNVHAGEYEFIAKASDEDGKVSSAVKKFRVVVYAPFYRTVSFKAVLIVAFMGLGYLLYRLRIKQIQEDAKKKEEIRRIRAEAEISALRSQMNPHFIFNCLNTVDSYILLNKTDEASEFLNKFSKLIRKILENSRRELIPLDQDLEALELYIKLEQERSHSRFSYAITKDRRVAENDYLIPSMIIQPFVENAILHGLRHKREEGGLLIITVERREDQLLISIKDNGIGREASSGLSTAMHRNKDSVGILLTEERVRKLNGFYPDKARLQITDIVEEGARGTLIEIYLPVITQEDIFL